jgi:hypothetical protein
MTMTKERLKLLGWTESGLRERLQGCRDGIKEINLEKQSAWTYRFLFIELYLKYKSWLKILTS